MFLKTYHFMLFTSVFMSSALLAQENNSHESEFDEDHKPFVSEGDNPNITDSVQRRGRVTQGVIGSEADDNKKLVPEDSPGDPNGQSPNIRLPDIEQDKTLEKYGDEPDN